MPIDASDSETIRLYGDAIEIVVDRGNGGVRRIRNRVTDQVLCDSPEGGTPVTSQQKNHSFAMPLVPPLPDVHHPGYDATDTSITVDDAADTIGVRWTTSDPEVAITARYALSAEGAIEIHGAVRVGDALPPESFAFPVLANVQPLEGDGSKDVLVWPAHSGWLIPNPLGGMHAGRYPDGWRGLSLQMMAYYTPGKGGFYVATHDPHSTQKQFRFSAGGISIRHDTWDIRRGADMDLRYPVVIAALTRGDWHEAADRYRSWAVANAPWTRRGPVAKRPDSEVPRWLYEEVGLNIWGPPASVDWSTWYRHYASVVDTPLHVTAGWDWPATRPHHVGKEGWFPAKIDPANREAWKGHRVTPYLNDVFVSVRTERFMEDWEPNLVQPYEIFPFTGFSEPPVHHGNTDVRIQDPRVTADVAFFVCPATEALRDLHLWRNLELIRPNDLDGVYYDISSGVGLGQRCLRGEHGHTPGAARSIVEAYDSLNERTLKEGVRELGRCPAQGTELIIEPILGHIDFFNSRACGGPVGALEAYSPAPEDPPGRGRELIPLFQAVYHDYGPVHQDGWSQLSLEYGDIFFWVAGRTVLQWGGMLSLEYAIHRPERFSENDPAVTFVGWDGGLYTYEDLPELDPEKARFCNELALARTGFTQPYLSYGRMLRPVDLGSVPFIDVDYRLEYDAVIPGGFRAGTWSVPQVLHAAWQAPDGRVGLVFVNLHESNDITVSAKGDGGDLWNLGLSGAAIHVVQRDHRREAGSVADDGTFAVDVELSPRRVTLVELSPSI